MRFTLVVPLLLGLGGPASASDAEPCHYQTGPEHVDIFDHYVVVNHCAGEVHIEYDYYGNGLGPGKHLHLTVPPCTGRKQYALSAQTSEKANIWLDPDAESKVCIKGAAVRRYNIGKDKPKSAPVRGAPASAGGSVPSSVCAADRSQCVCEDDTNRCIKRCVEDAAEAAPRCMTQCTEDAAGGGFCFRPTTY